MYVRDNNERTYSLTYTRTDPNKEKKRRNV